MFLTAKNFRLQEENINISEPQGKTTNYENVMHANGMGYHRKRRERGREDAVLYKKEDKSLIDVENVEPTGERSCHLS